MASSAGGVLTALLTIRPSEHKELAALEAVLATHPATALLGGGDHAMLRDGRPPRFPSLAPISKPATMRAGGWRDYKCLNCLSSSGEASVAL